MPNVIQKTKISDGSSRAIFHFYLEADGIAGELKNAILIDPETDFDPGQRIQLSITKIWSANAVYDMLIKFNALIPTPAWVVGPDSESFISFDYFGGLKDYSSAEPDGKILLSTNGFNQADNIGTLILEVKKN